MKTFKLTDWLLSTALILFFVVSALLGNIKTAVYGYLIVGGWQLTSMMIHSLNRWFTADKKRLYYHWTTIIIIWMGLAAYITPAFFFIFPIMLWAAPFMAIYYTWMCFKEWRRMGHRPLAVLK